MRALRWCWIRAQRSEAGRQALGRLCQTPQYATHREPFVRYYNVRNLGATTCSSVNGASAPSEQINTCDHILKEAVTYGITDIDKLAYEADVGHRQQSGSRLIDHTANRQDLDLWVVLLDYRFLVDGERGVEDILYGMRFRGEAVKLFSDDVASDYIWNALIPLAIRSEVVLGGLCSPVSGIAKDRPGIFIELVGLLLREGQIIRARDTASWLRSKYRGRSDLLQLFRIACDSNKVSMEHFCQIYQRLPRTSIYGDVVPKLLLGDSSSDAWLLHSFLLQQGDLPTKFEDVEPLVRDLAIQGKPLKPFLDNLAAYDVSFPAQSRYVYKEAKAGSLSSASSIDKQAGVTIPVRRQHKLSDEFIARAFATTSISFDFVLSALRPFGMLEVGPLAIRQMALSATSLTVLKQRFAKLQELEIDLGSSAYVAIVKNLCTSNSELLLQAILRSDQHHEVFEDEGTQRRLLAKQYSAKNWMAVNQTLAVLNRGKTTVESQRYSSRLLLQTAITLRDWRGVLQILGDMNRRRHRGEAFTKPVSIGMSLSALIRIMLPKTSNVEDTSHLVRGEYLAGLLQEMHCSGIHIAAQHWRRVLFYFGNLCKLDQFEKLCLWIATHYSQRQDGCRLHVSFHTRYKVSLDTIFDAELQASVIESCLRAAPFIKTTLEEEKIEMQARRAMQLLRQLETEFGIAVNIESVREAYMLRLSRTNHDHTAIKILLQIFDIISKHDDPKIDPQSLPLRIVSPSTIHIRHLLKALLRTSSAKIRPAEAERNARNEFAVNGEEQENLRDDVSPMEATVNDGDDYVEYQDLFHPASKEYTEGPVLRIREEGK